MEKALPREVSGSGLNAAHEIFWSKSCSNQDKAEISYLLPWFLNIHFLGMTHLFKI